MTRDKGRQRLFEKKDGSEERLGIGIVTYNRPETLDRCIRRVLQHTRRNYEFVIADDGSEDSTSRAVTPFIDNLLYLKCKNRGVNFNKNRLLFYLSNIRQCDIIIIIEDDAFPNADGWEESWIAATKRYGHINYAGVWFQESFTSGEGSVDNPYLSPDVSAQCVGFSREAVEYVGFIDPALENYGGGHAEHTYRMTRAGYGGEFKRDGNGLGRPEFYLINGHIDVTYVETGYPTGDDVGLQRYYDLRDGPIYRHAWRNDDEQKNLWDELISLT